MSPDLIITSGLLELYMAGALSLSEMQEVDALAEAHPVIRAELDKIEEALMQYAVLQSPKGPPDVLKDISTSIHDEPQEIVAAPVAVPPAKLKKEKEKERKVVREPDTITDSTAFPEKERTGYGSGVIILLVILLLGALAAAYYFYDQWQRSELQSSEAVTNEEEAARILEESKNRQEDLETELAIYKNPKFKVVNLNAMDTSPAADAIVFWNPVSKETWIRVDYLPPAPEGKQYQLWMFDTEDKPLSAGMIRLEGTKSNLMRMDDISGSKAFAITLESEGGSLEPARKRMFMLGDVE